MAEDGAGPSTIIASRRAQAFPRLSAAEIDRLRRFGAVRSYGDGERLFAAGETGPGMFVVLNGIVAVTRLDGLGHHVPVIKQGEGSFSPRSASSPVGRPSSTAMPGAPWRRCCCRQRA